MKTDSKGRVTSEGTFINGRSYLLWEIMQKFGVKDSRSVVNWLEINEIPILLIPKGDMLVLGDEINDAVRRNGACRNRRAKARRTSK